MFQSDGSDDIPQDTDFISLDTENHNPITEEGHPTPLHLQDVNAPIHTLQGGSGGGGGDALGAVSLSQTTVNNNNNEIVAGVGDGNRVPLSGFGPVASPFFFMCQYPRAGEPSGAPQQEDVALKVQFSGRRSPLEGYEPHSVYEGENILSSHEDIMKLCGRWKTVKNFEHKALKTRDIF